MVKKARGVITELWKLKWNNVQLVSGGAAWADHVAVSLFLMYQPKVELQLYLPCEWDGEARTFVDDGTRNWRTNPGGTANSYHRRFSDRMGKETLHGIDSAFNLGATKQVIPGFKARNAGPASSDYLLAFTWGEGDVPKDGGTKDTWDKAHQFEGTRLHIPLISLK